MSHLEENSLVSVIIPTYNNNQTILVAIKSVLEQSYTNFEIIIINDGSTDNTDIIIKQFIKKISDVEKEKIIYLTKANSGPSDSRNLGIKKAKGNFIAFLDADDYWYYNKLEIQINYFNRFPDTVLVATAFGNKRLKDESKYKIITFKKLLVRNLFSTPAVMINRRRYKLVSFNSSQKYSEDYRLWLDIAFNNRCLYINEILAGNQFQKNDFGDSGLSSNLWKMTKGELSNYINLYNKKQIKFLTVLLISSYSFMKFTRRLILTWVINIKRTKLFLSKD